MVADLLLFAGLAGVIVGVVLIFGLGAALIAVGICLVLLSLALLDGRGLSWRS
jgi:hypothetical protein